MVEQSVERPKTMMYELLITGMHICRVVNEMGEGGLRSEE
jgi:hypothetical protein